MKWFLALLAIAALLGIFFFLPAKDVQQDDSQNPDKPWLRLEPSPDSSEEKEARADDPRSVSDRILQKDYCAASEYFRYGKHRGELASFLRNDIWPKNADDRRELSASSQPILAALFAQTREEAISKLKYGQSADQKLLLGMYQGGLTGMFEGKPGSDELHDALVSLDEAEDLFPTNSIVPIYRGMVMLKQGMSADQVSRFLKEELPKRVTMESPLAAARLDYLQLASRGPVRFAASTPTYVHLEDSQLSDVEKFLGQMAAQDSATAKLVVQAADQWQKNELEKLAPDMPDLFTQLDTMELAAKIGRDAWGKAYPGVALPERFEEQAVARIAAKHRDRNPIEAYRYFGAKREETCGAKWKEAVDADFEMVRDRLRKKMGR